MKGVGDDVHLVLGDEEGEVEVGEGVDGDGRQELGSDHPRFRAMSRMIMLGMVFGHRIGLRTSGFERFGKGDLTVEWVC